MCRKVEPISNSFQQHIYASNLHESQEVLGVVLPSTQDATFPLKPREEPFDEPTTLVATQTSAILRALGRTALAVRRDHLDTLLAQFAIQLVAVVGALANQILRLRLDHVELKAQ